MSQRLRKGPLQKTVSMWENDKNVKKINKIDFLSFMFPENRDDAEHIDMWIMYIF